MKGKIKKIGIEMLDRVKELIRGPVERERIHEYWKNPMATNKPTNYLDGREKSRFLLELCKRYLHARDTPSILEIGCNVGRNLNELFVGGFEKLNGIEINADAIQLMRKTYPKMSKTARIETGPVEDIIQKQKPGSFDLVFTMAVLEHIHPDSEFVFGEMARTTKRFIITIEDESSKTWRHFPRNYRRIFENHGMKQVEEIRGNEVDRVLPEGGYTVRIFSKEERV